MTVNKSENKYFWEVFLIRNYTLLWLSSFLSMLSTQIRIISTGFILYEITGSGLSLVMLGIIQLFFQLPSILFGGVFADYLKRTTLITVTQLIGTLVVGLLSYFDFTNSLTDWHIYIATAILSVN